MANTLTDILPKILANGLTSLRERVMMTRLVNLDWDMETAMRGKTIDVPVPTEMNAARDVTPAAYPTAPSDYTLSTVQVQLTNWKHADFALTDQEIGQIAAGKNFLPMQTQEAFRQIAKAINTSVYEEYTNVYGYTGTAGATPFGTGVEMASATNLRKILHRQLCPRDDRRIVLDYDAEAAALNLAQFSDADKRGSGETKISGELGRILGFDWYGDDSVPTHTMAGTKTGALTVNGAHSVGDKTISIAKGAGTNWPAAAGDIITFAGDTQTYVIPTATTVTQDTNTTVTIEPGIKVALSGGEAVTVKESHVVNLGFHRNAFALAMRAPGGALKEEIGQAHGGPVIASLTMPDPFSGVILRLEIIRGYKMTIWDLDCLWGVKCVRPELAARLAG